MLFLSSGVHCGPRVDRQCRMTRLELTKLCAEDLLRKDLVSYFLLLPPPSVRSRPSCATGFPHISMVPRLLQLVIYKRQIWTCICLSSCRSSLRHLLLFLQEVYPVHLAIPLVFSAAHRAVLPVQLHTFPIRHCVCSLPVMSKSMSTYVGRSARLEQVTCAILHTYSFQPVTSRETIVSLKIAQAVLVSSPA